jgi:hypothetical protein
LRRDAGEMGVEPGEIGANGGLHRAALGKNGKSLDCMNASASC